MSAARSTKIYEDGVMQFVEFAEKNAGMVNRFLCPCRSCGNRYWITQQQVVDHLICKGFMRGYTSWIYHGENFEEYNPEYLEPEHDSNTDDEQHSDRHEITRCW